MSRKTIYQMLKDEGYDDEQISIMKYTHKITGLEYKSIAILMENVNQNNTDYIDLINKAIEDGEFQTVKDVDNFIQSTNSCYEPNIDF